MIRYICNKKNKIYTETNMHICKKKHTIFYRIRNLIFYYIIIILNYFYRNTNKRTSSKKVDYILSKIQTGTLLNKDDIDMISKLSYKNIIILIKNCNERIIKNNLQKISYTTTRHTYVDTISIQSKIYYKFRHFIPLTEIDIEQLTELETTQLIEIIKFYNNCIKSEESIG